MSETTGTEAKREQMRKMIASRTDAQLAFLHTLTLRSSYKAPRADFDAYTLLLDMIERDLERREVPFKECCYTPESQPHDRKVCDRTANPRTLRAADALTAIATARMAKLVANRPEG